MKKYDAIVIGSGCGLNIVEEALEHGLKVALVDKGPLGGTCPNSGCIPSKMMIFAADRVVEIQDSKKLGVETEIKNINFNYIMERVRMSIADTQKQVKNGILLSKELDFYEGEGHFTGEYTLTVNGKEIKGKKIFIASGSRPIIPPLKGLDGIDYLTNESVLQLKEKPESLVIIGGGYIAVEYGHFFAAMGTKVTMLEMADRLVLAEEPEISDLLKKELSKRMAVYTGMQAESFSRDGNADYVQVTDLKDGSKKKFSAQKILVAIGRRSNADLLKVENTGIKVDKKGFIPVNEFMETNVNNIYAVGDADGQQMFTHVANRESVLAVQNAIHGNKEKMDYNAAPHAVYSHPQIASVGLTEEVARKNHKVLIGRAKYFEVAAGEAMMETEGFAKAIVEDKTGKILGFHIIGPYAPSLIQEVINAMASGSTVDQINAGMHIHPAPPELIMRTLSNLQR